METKSIDYKNIIEKSISKFVTDRDNTELSSAEKQELINIKKNSSVNRFLPQLFPNVPISSIKVADFIRESKLRINILASQTALLHDEVTAGVNSFWSTLDDIQNELKGLDSDIQEEEIKIEDRYQQVHYNAFNRPIDGYIAAEGPIADPKTNLPFLKNHKLWMIPGTGLVLPKAQEHDVYIKNICILDETTNVGDSVLPLISSDPNDLKKPGKFFKHVIAKKMYDESGRLYNYTDVLCTLNLEFGHIQLINFLKIKPLSHNPIFIKSIEYINEATEKMSIALDTLFLDNSIHILLEPLRTNNLIITFIQYSPVEEVELSVDNLSKKTINDTLRGADWSVLLNETGTLLKSKVYDFSLESIVVGLVSYKEVGYFLSQKINVKQPLSLSLSLDTESIQITSEQQAYGTNYSLPENTVLYETYLKIHLEDFSKNKQINSFIPIPTSTKAQTEFLPLIGGESKICFVPDLFYTASRFKIKKANYYGAYAFLECAQAHGIPERIIFTDPLEIYAGKEYPTLSFVSEYWEAFSPTMLVLKRSDGIIGLGIVSENTTPQAYAVRQLNSIPLSIYREGSALVLGSDYYYSVDNGVTWETNWLTLKDFIAKNSDFAGSFRIKILNPDYDKYYWCSYRRKNKQYLHQNKKFLLKKNSVIFDKSLKNTQGSLQTMIVLRSDNRISYLSSVIRNYKLKVREI